jgi:trans-aconitate 2-methyltransferase
MDWNPELYEQFRRYRERPAKDLLAAMHGFEPRLVYDLGCGTGRITLELARRYPSAEVVGLDISAAMLDRDASADPVNLRFELGDIASWDPPTPPDVIFSNAALHWLPDHEVLLPRLVSRLAPGGHLYIQMPRNFAEPDHRTIERVVHEGRWAERLKPLWSEARVGAPESYVELLGPSCSELDVWETVYYQRLRGPNPVARWIEGAALRPYLAVLGGQRQAFLDAIDAEILAAYPPDDHGVTLYPFRRLFITGVAAA